MLGIFKKAKFIFLALLGAAVCIWIFFNSTAIGLMLVYLLIIYLLVIKFDGFCEAISIKPSKETPSLLFGASAQVFALLLIAFCVFVLSIPSDELSSKPVFE